MTDYFLSKGKHVSAKDGRCAMEWTAYLAGLDHTDRPACVSPMLLDFAVSLNDALPDGQRQRLRPYLARCIGTAGDGLDGERGWLCADWLVREYVPAWFDLTPALAADAAALRALPPVSAETVERATVNLGAARVHAAAARDAAWAAAGAAVWAAVGDATWDAVGAAAWDATWAATRVAAGAAAGAAVGDATWDAAWDAAWAAAGDALAPTVLRLQDSMLGPGGLLDRLLPTELVSVPVVADWERVCALP